jgi:AAA domain/Bifunctional DNA primase/polymerase, N-terminal
MTVTNDARAMSVYEAHAPLLVALGLCPLPIEPGTKRPALYTGGGYAPMVNWTTRPPITAPQPGAGIGVRLGDVLVALDIDTDDAAIGCALIDEVLPSPELRTVTKAGKRGQTLFFRVSEGERIPSKRFKVNGVIVAELLSSGKQTVLPPTVHPDTQLPYVWGNGMTLYNTDISTLPELPTDAVERIEAALAPFGYEREEEAVFAEGAEDSPFKQFNNYAQDRIDEWVPALGLHKCSRSRGRFGGWQAVAHWRPSTTGRPLEQRNPNLKIGRKVIYDHGAGRSYSPIDLVMAALAMDFDSAFKWLDEKTGWSKTGPNVDFEALAGANKPEKTPEAPDSPPKYRFKLVAFSAMRPGLEQLYLVDELIPVAGLVDIWGPPKCFKSFWTLDLMLHVAMGWEYRDRCVHQGAVVYCAFEGAHGYKKRIEALRRHYAIEEGTPVPLYIMPGQANLIAEHKLLIRDIVAQLGDVKPAAVVLDTLNKSLLGSESKDIDMSAYVRAAEAIRDAFECVVIIVHHCGLDETRPRGHTSLPGAVDAQLAVTREGNVVTVVVEMMRDGPEDTAVNGIVEPIEVGEDANGKTLTSLVVKPGEGPVKAFRPKWGGSLAVFRRALSEALLNSSLTHQIPGGALVHVADLETVRAEYYKIYVAKGDTQPQQQDARRQAFYRCVDKAQVANLIGVHVSDSQRVVWLADSHDGAPA